MKINNKLVKIIDLLFEITVSNKLTFDSFLKKLIKIIDQVIEVDSCLIYFYDKDNNKLILIGSKIPHKNLLGKISLKKGEGITGWVFEHKKPVVIKEKAYQDRRFKFFKELPEDKYEAFLSIPIYDEKEVIGVINLQNKNPYQFDKKTVKTLQTIAKIIASAFRKVYLERQVNFFKNKLEERKIIEKAKGILMEKEKLSENEAYKKLRNEAMRKRKTLKEIAEAVILVWG